MTDTSVTDYCIALFTLGFVFDVAYTSYLKRAIRTLWHTLEQTELMYIPIINAWELNERYGQIFINAAPLKAVAHELTYERSSSLVPFGEVYSTITFILTYRHLMSVINSTFNCFRHYGALQGLDKQETVDKYGKDQVNVW